MKLWVFLIVALLAFSSCSRDAVFQRKFDRLKKNYPEKFSDTSLTTTVEIPSDTTEFSWEVKFQDSDVDSLVNLLDSLYAVSYEDSMITDAVTGTLRVLKEREVTERRKAATKAVIKGMSELKILEDTLKIETEDAWVYVWQVGSEIKNRVVSKPKKLEIKTPAIVVQEVDAGIFATLSFKDWFSLVALILVIVMVARNWKKKHEKIQT